MRNCCPKLFYPPTLVELYPILKTDFRTVTKDKNCWQRHALDSGPGRTTHLAEGAFWPRGISHLIMLQKFLNHSGLSCQISLLSQDKPKLPCHAQFTEVQVVEIATRCFHFLSSNLSHLKLRSINVRLTGCFIPLADKSSTNKRRNRVNTAVDGLHCSSFSSFSPRLPTDHADPLDYQLCCRGCHHFGNHSLRDLLFQIQQASFGRKSGGNFASQSQPCEAQASGSTIVTHLTRWKQYRSAEECAKVRWLHPRQPLLEVIFKKWVQKSRKIDDFSLPSISLISVTEHIDLNSRTVQRSFSLLSSYCKCVLYQMSFVEWQEDIRRQVKHLHKNMIQQRKTI